MERWPCQGSIIRDKHTAFRGLPIGASGRPDTDIRLRGVSHWNPPNFLFTKNYKAGVFNLVRYLLRAYTYNL